MLLRGVPLDRIGHGTYLHPDVGGTEEIVQHVASNRIPIGSIPGVRMSIVLPCLYE